MRNTKNIKQRLYAQLNTKRGEYLARALNLVEPHLVMSPDWPNIRRQLFKLYGDRGLAGDIRFIVDCAFDGGEI